MAENDPVSAAAGIAVVGGPRGECRGGFATGGAVRDDGRGGFATGGAVPDVRGAALRRPQENNVPRGQLPSAAVRGG